MNKNSILTIVALTMVLGLVACELHPGVSSPLLTPVSPLPTSTPLPSPIWTLTVESTSTQVSGSVPTEMPTRQLCPSPTPGGPVWRILFRGTPCSEMLNPGCQPFDDTPIYSYVINSDGSGLERMDAFSPFSLLSPDGAHLAYTTENGLYLAHPDGTNSVRLTDHWTSFDFSPDGQYIVYGENQPNGNIPDVLQAEIGRIHIDSLQRVALAVLPIENINVYASLDSEWILVQGRSWNPITYRLYLVRMDDGEVRELFHLDRIGPVRWSPTGTEIEFLALQREGEIYINALQTIDRNGGNLQTRWSIADLGFWIHWGDWSPDGQELAFAIEPVRAELLPGLYVLNVYNGCWRNILSEYSVTQVRTWRTERVER